MANRVMATAESPAANFDSLPDSAYVGSNVVCALYGVRSLVTLWKWKRAGRIPPSRKLAGSRNNSWNVGDLRAALAQEANHAPA